MSDRNKALVVRVILGCLALASIYIPWFTVIGIDVAGSSIRWMLALLLLLVVALVLSVLAAYQPPAPSFVDSACAIWSLGVAVGVAYLVYALFIMSIRSFGPGLPLLIAATSALLWLDWKQRDPMHTKLLLGGGLAVLALSLVIAVPMGWNARNGAHGLKLEPSADTMFRNAFESTAKGFPTPSSPPPPEIAVQVRNWYPATQLNAAMDSTYQPDAGKRYIVMTITATNHGKEKEYVSPTKFKLTCSDRNVYRANDFMMMPPTGIDWISAELLPGGATTGQTVFEVAQSANPVSIEYAASIW